MKAEVREVFTLKSLLNLWLCLFDYELNLTLDVILVLSGVESLLIFSVCRQNL